MVRESNVEFVDGLLGVLGLKSVMRCLAQPKGRWEGHDVARTGIYGRAYLSMKNRRIMLEAICQEPRPLTLRELQERLTILAEEYDPHDVAEILAAVECACEEEGGRRLEDYVRAHTTTNSG